MNIASSNRANRPAMILRSQYFREMKSGMTSTAPVAATASHAARDRDNTSVAATAAAPSDPSSSPNGRLDVTVDQTITGRPIAAMCATKFLFPNVPPGARFTLK
jgi:hypothetical protein